MYCPKCGAPNSDAAQRCTNCLEPLPAAPGAQPHIHAEGEAPHTPEAPSAQEAPQPQQQAPTGQPAQPDSSPYQQPQQPYQQPYQQAPQQPYQQGQPPYGQPPFGGYQQQLPPKPATFLAGNIIMTILSLCSCLGTIPGIVGIVFSAMVSSKYNQGDYEGAKSMAKVAKILFWVTLGLAVAGIVLIVVMIASSASMYGSYGLFDSLYDIY